MKKETSNLTVSTGTEKCSTLEERIPTLEERILHSNLSEQDKIELIKIIGRQGTGNYGGNIYYPLTSSGHPDCPKPTVTYCSCCCEE